MATPAGAKGRFAAAEQLFGLIHLDGMALGLAGVGSQQVSVKRTDGHGSVEIAFSADTARARPVVAVLGIVKRQFHHCRETQLRCDGEAL